MVPIIKPYVLLQNPGFEIDGFKTSAVTGWVASGLNPEADFTEVDGSLVAHTGALRLVHWRTYAYQVTTSQTVTGLTNGTYTLKAYVQSSGGQSTAQMQVSNFGGTQLNANISASGSYTQIVIPNIQVTNGQATIGFNSNAAANQWILVDDVEFTMN